MANTNHSLLARLRRFAFGLLTAATVFLSTFKSSAQTIQPRTTPRGNRVEVQNNGNIVIQNGNTGNITYDATGLFLNSTWKNNGAFIPGVIGAQVNQTKGGNKEVVIQLAPGVKLDSAQEAQISEAVYQKLAKQFQQAKTAAREDSARHAVPATALQNILHPNTGNETVVTFTPTPVSVTPTPTINTDACPWDIRKSGSKTLASLTPGHKGVQHFNNLVIDEARHSSRAQLGIRLAHLGWATAHITLRQHKKGVNVSVENLRINGQSASPQGREKVEHFLKHAGTAELERDISTVLSGNCTPAPNRPAEHIHVSFPPSKLTLITAHKPPVANTQPPVTVDPCDSVRADNQALRQDTAHLGLQLRSERFAVKRSAIRTQQGTGTPWWTMIAATVAGLAIGLGGGYKIASKQRPANPALVQSAGSNQPPALLALAQATAATNTQDAAHNANLSIADQFQAAKKSVQDYRRTPETNRDSTATMENLNQIAAALPGAFQDTPKDAFVAARYAFNTKHKTFDEKDYGLLQQIADNLQNLGAAPETQGRTALQAANFVIRHASGAEGQPLRQQARLFRAAYTAAHA